MNASVRKQRSVVANTVYGLLDPIPFGFFAAALIFDVIYAQTTTILWGKAAAWLVTIALFIAIIPRLINLVQVWVTARRSATAIDRLDFLLNLGAIVAAIFNAFVHSRDAYAMVPAAVWLSALTVALLAISRVLIVGQQTQFRNATHA